MPCVVAHACNPGTLEAEASGLPCVQGQPGLQRELQSSFNIESDSVSKDKTKEYTFPSRYGTEVHMDHTGLQPEEQS